MEGYQERLEKLREAEKAIHAMGTHLHDIRKEIAEQSKILEGYKEKAGLMITMFAEYGEEAMDNIEELREVRRKNAEGLELIKILQKRSLDNLEKLEQMHRLNEENRAELESTQSRLADLQVCSPMSPAECSFGGISEISTSFEAYRVHDVLDESSTSLLETGESSSDTLEETSDGTSDTSVSS